MYEAYITTLKNVRKHSNADRLKVAECFGNQVIVDLDSAEGEMGIYFPVDGKLGKEYAETNNLLRKKDEQGNEIGGYLDPDKRNIKAIKLRGEKSDGLFMPLSSLADFCNLDDVNVGDRITTLNGTLICEKYIPRSNKRHSNTCNKLKTKKVIDFPLFKEHTDTEQLDYNLGEFKKGDLCYITLKMHGTSQRTAYLPKENDKNFFTRWLNKIHKKWDIVTGTRRVVLNNIDKAVDGGFYGNDGFRKGYHDFFKGKLQKGESIYYEVVGYVNETTPIMPDGDNKKVQDKEFTKQYGDKTRFSYGCEQGFNNIYVYRMTMTNEDGYAVEYPYELVKTRCEEMGANCVLELERFIYTTEDNLLKRVDKYLDITDPIGKTHIAEGIVVRIDNKKTFKAYKKKGFFFKVLEGIIKDTAIEADMEEIQE